MGQVWPSLPQRRLPWGKGLGELSYWGSCGVSGPEFRLFLTDLLEIRPGGF